MPEHGNRAAFLDNVRGRLAAEVPPNATRPLMSLDGTPPVFYEVDTSDSTGTFTRAGQAVGVEVRRIAGSHGVGDVLREIVQREGVGRAVLSRDPECAHVSAVLSDLGVVTQLGRGPATAAAADLGVTGAVAGVALTGSLVVDAGRAGGRTASLLPPIHLAILKTDAIVPTPGDLFRNLRTRYPSGLPSGLVFITGPSRSADIELHITLGVHGPRSVWVAITD